MNTGLVYAFTGDGKGKTSAALGVATRSLLLDKNVVWVAFYKQESWGLSEAKLKDKFPNLEMFFSGKGFSIASGERLVDNSKIKTAKVGDKGHLVVDTASEDEHRDAAREGIRLAESKLQKNPFLLVLDEVINAVSEGLLDSKHLIELLEKRGSTHIVLTGRGMQPAGSLPEGLLEVVDLVTECRKIKHPYDLGKLAVAGLDF